MPSGRRDHLCFPGGFYDPLAHFSTPPERRGSILGCIFWISIRGGDRPAGDRVLGRGVFFFFRICRPGNLCPGRVSALPSHRKAPASLGIKIGRRFARIHSEKGKTTRMQGPGDTIQGDQISCWPPDFCIVYFLNLKTVSQKLFSGFCVLNFNLENLRLPC